MDIKVLGTGCSNCINTVTLIEEVARSKGIEISMQKVEDIKDIMSYGVMSTPAVIIDDQIVHAGGIPAREKIERLLSQ